MTSQNSDQPVAVTSQVDTPRENGRDLIRALLLCLAAVVFVRSFVFEPFKIPSSSMVPTLKIGDRIFVSKFSYGLSLPFSKVELVRFGAPQRGDVVVFLSPREESLHYVKRVVGVPGDKLEFRGKEIFINGVAVGKQLVSDKALIDQLMEKSEGVGEIYEESLGGGKHYVRFSKGDLGDYVRPNLEEVIPEDSFFVVGDNRDESYDSRSWGIVPRENIKGKAIMVWLSLDSEGRSNSAVRWDRCGTLIH